MKVNFRLNWVNIRTGLSWEDVLKCTETRLVMVHKLYLRVFSGLHFGIQLHFHKTVVAGKLSFIIKVEIEHEIFLLPINIDSFIHFGLPELSLLCLEGIVFKNFD